MPTSKPVRWLEAKDNRAVIFTIWLTKSSVPPWGYGADHEIVATLPLTNGEFVLVAGHYVDPQDARAFMFRGLGGFIQMLMEEDTSGLEPLDTDATLMGFSVEPSGIRTISEIALWGLTRANETDEAPHDSQQE